jgi:hypothetical protein
MIDCNMLGAGWGKGGKRRKRDKYKKERDD